MSTVRSMDLDQYKSIDPNLCQCMWGPNPCPNPYEYVIELMADDTHAFMKACDPHYNGFMEQWQLKPGSSSKLLVWLRADWEGVGREKKLMDSIKEMDEGG